MKLGPLPDDNACFVAGGVSPPGHWYVSERYDFELPRGGSEPESKPEPWTCSFCGSENPPDTWSCSHCPAPRTKATKSERAIWQPPIRVESHKEPIKTGIPGLDWMAERVPHESTHKLPPPWWIVLLMVILWVVAVVTGLVAFAAIFLAPGPLPIVLVSVFILCYYIFSKIRGPLKRRYDWGTSD